MGTTNTKCIFMFPMTNSPRKTFTGTKNMTIFSNESRVDAQLFGTKKLIEVSFADFYDYKRFLLELTLTNC